MRPVGMVCHRGANKVAPENTLAAVRAAFDLGAECVEIDVRTSADGLLMVIHDPTVDRTTDGSGPVAGFSASELGALDAGSWFSPTFAGERVPPLDDVLALARGRGQLYVEIKAADPPVVIEAVEAAGMLEDCFFWSGDPALREGLTKDHRALRLMIREKDYDDLPAAVARYRPAIVEFTPDAMTPAQAALCRQNGAQAMGFYAGGELEVFQALIEAGVSLINLDHPEVFNRIMPRSS